MLNRARAAVWGPAPPPRRSRLLDGWLAVGAGVVDAALLWRVEHFFLPGPVIAGISLVLGLCLVVRRRYPVGIALTCILASLAAGAGILSYLIACYTLGAYATSRRVVTAVAMLGLALFVVQPGPGLYGEHQPLWLLAMIGVVMIASPVLLGLYMGTRKQLIGSLRERAARLEREQHLLAERARAEERARIARDMHDVVANRVSVMVVHAGALRAVAAKDPARAVEMATMIGDMGRQALDELRHVIGVLRVDGDGTPLPVPGPEELRELVGQSREAGMEVSLVIDGERRPLPAAVARVTYRLVQEALTNVHKHAGGARTWVTVRHLADAVEACVENAAPSAVAAEGLDPLPSGGNGLRGLRERVTALGGTFEAGERESGGFTVRARLPLPAGT